MWYGVYDSYAGIGYPLDIMTCHPLQTAFSWSGEENSVK